MEEYKDDNSNNDDNLTKQYESVRKEEMIAAEKFESEIMELTCPPQDVMTWWRVRDPLLETYESELTVDPPDVLSKAKRKIELFSRASVCLYVSNLFDDPDSLEAPDWAKKIIEDNGLRSSDDFDQEMHTLLRLGNEKYKSLQGDEVQFSKENFGQLLTSAEIARAALSINANIKAHNFSLFEACNNALDIVQNGTSIKEQPNSTQDQINEVDEIRMMALQACLNQNAITESYRIVGPEGDIRRPDDEMLDTMLAYLVHDLKKIFANEDDPSCTTWKRLKSSIIKGSLHEALWYLDFVMLKHMYSGKYATFDVMPAHSFADRPEIGNPEHNRAYDFYVRSVNGPEGKSFRDFVQLKSSPQSQNKPGSRKRYHPSIQVVEEQNFMDVNPSRLRAKLNTYMNILKGSFQEADKEKLDKYVLPSVKEYFDSVQT